MEIREISLHLSYLCSSVSICGETPRAKKRRAGLIGPARCVQGSVSLHISDHTPVRSSRSARSQFSSSLPPVPEREM
jgi:hypothetical protein